MSAPELSAEEAAIVARFEAAPVLEEAWESEVNETRGREASLAYLNGLAARSTNPLLLRAVAEVRATLGQRP